MKDRAKLRIYRRLRGRSYERQTKGDAADRTRYQHQEWSTVLTALVSTLAILLGSVFGDAFEPASQNLGHAI